jgi:hypothetical protein
VSNRLRLRSVTDASEHESGRLVSTEGGKILDHMSDFQLLQKGCDP